MVDFSKAADAVDSYIDDMARILLHGTKVKQVHSYLQGRMSKLKHKQLVDLSVGLLVQQAIIRAAELEASKIDDEQA